MCDALSIAEVRNIIFLGKTGVGKSATLNTILGENYFRTGHGASVTSHCSSTEATINGMKIRLIDTPGEKDTRDTNVSKKIDDYVLEQIDGIHVFVLVLSVSNRPTDDDIDVINQVQKQLGPGLEERLMIIVTRTEELEDGETPKGFLQSYASKHPIVATCLKRNRVLGFENGKHATDADKKKQLEQFIDKAQTIIKDNGESFYTHAQLKKQKDAREKENARLREKKLREEKEKKDLKDRLERTERELSALRGASTGFRGFLATAGTCAGNLFEATTNLAVGATGIFAAGARMMAHAPIAPEAADRRVLWFKGDM